MWLCEPSRCRTLISHRLSDRIAHRRISPSTNEIGSWICSRCSKYRSTLIALSRCALCQSRKFSVFSDSHSNIRQSDIPVSRKRNNLKRAAVRRRIQATNVPNKSRNLTWLSMKSCAVPPENVPAMIDFLDPPCETLHCGARALRRGICDEKSRINVMKLYSCCPTSHSLP